MNISSISNTAFADSLSPVYADKWDGVSAAESNSFIQFMSSNDLIFVVLAVTLIIWFVLVFYLVRVDSKINKLEEKVNLSNENHSTS
jgi:CcmD family protein